MKQNFIWLAVIFGDVSKLFLKCINHFSEPEISIFEPNIKKDKRLVLKKVIYNVRICASNLKCWFINFRKSVSLLTCTFLRKIQFRCFYYFYCFLSCRKFGGI